MFVFTFICKSSRFKCDLRLDCGTWPPSALDLLTCGKWPDWQSAGRGRWLLVDKSSLKSKATLTNKIMICMLWWLLLFIEMMLDPLWWQKERCEGTVIGQMLARVDGGGAWGGAIEHRWQWSIRATDASGKGVAGILPRICLFTCVCACTWQAGRKKVLWDLRYYRDNFLSKTPNPLKNLCPQPIRSIAMFKTIKIAMLG